MGGYQGNGFASVSPAVEEQRSLRQEQDWAYKESLQVAYHDTLTDVGAVMGYARNLTEASHTPLPLFPFLVEGGNVVPCGSRHGLMPDGQAIILRRRRTGSGPRPKRQRRRFNKHWTKQNQRPKQQKKSGNSKQSKHTQSG